MIPFSITATVYMSLVYIWLCSPQVQFSTDIDDLLKAKDEVKSKEDTIKSKEDIIKIKEDTIKSKDVTIKAIKDTIKIQDNLIE